MTELINCLIEKAKTDKSLLLKLKGLAVKSNQLELASKLKEMENEFFPLTEQQKNRLEMAGQYRLALQMSGVEISEELASLVGETVRTFLKKKGSFSVKDAAQLKEENNELFGTNK